MVAKKLMEGRYSGFPADYGVETLETWNKQNRPMREVLMDLE